MPGSRPQKSTMKFRKSTVLAEPRQSRRERTKDLATYARRDPCGKPFARQHIAEISQRRRPTRRLRLEYAAVASPSFAVGGSQSATLSCPTCPRGPGGRGRRARTALGARSARSPRRGSGPCPGRAEMVADLYFNDNMKTQKHVFKLAASLSFMGCLFQR